MREIMLLALIAGCVQPAGSIPLTESPNDSLEMEAGEFSLKLRAFQLHPSSCVNFRAVEMLGRNLTLEVVWEAVDPTLETLIFEFKVRDRGFVTTTHSPYDLFVNGSITDGSASLTVRSETGVAIREQKLLGRFEVESAEKIMEENCN